ncbi:unnamed protein product [Didymodactylos carnosus]|uniref:Uncharacterized protein n=1 Tax=Didymodactylos carnosus TaxID=1234261 RepID=A0A8S2NQD9_9BILA|nr:unnamed protein product [Didymodactylos carnosus]CAF4012169.1 unnamed protein product [Didymodactylos carnosus]
MSSSGRHRDSSNNVTSPAKHNGSFAEEQALDAIAREAELRLKYQREQNREARELRHKELEKIAREDDVDDSSHISHTPSTPSIVNRTRGSCNDGSGNNTNTLLLQKFLNGDTDLRSIEQRDLRRLLSEIEIKYKQSMISNSSLYNEKQALRFQVDNFKDQLEEQIEIMNQIKRQLKEKTKEFDLQKRTLTDLQHDFSNVKELLENREKLIEESGMILYTDQHQQCNGNSSTSVHSDLISVLPTGLVSQETANLLNTLGNGNIDEKLKRLLSERRDTFEQIVRLKSELDDEQNRLKILEKQLPKINEHSQQQEHLEQQSKGSY